MGIIRNTPGLHSAHGSACLPAVAAAMLCATSIAQAASTDKFAVIDIMETVRQSEVESPFTAAFTGEQPGSVSMQLFDGDLTADSSKSVDQNGRALFVVKNGPSVTVSFNPATFGNRPVILGQYGFRMASVANTSWAVASRMPKSWTVSVSSKENPMTEDDWVLVDSRSGLTSAMYGPANGCYAADFQVEIPMAVRHVRFVFTSSIADQYLQLGEILMSGLIAPDESGRRDICLYKTAPVVANADGSAMAKVSILPVGEEVDPYDLFVTYGTGNHVETNLLEHASRFTGLYETTIPGLRLGADYTLQFGTVATNGVVELGDVVPFTSPLDVFAAGGLPGGFEKVEYIESTDTGCQYIDCGFAPSNDRLGFDIDFIGYNAFLRGAYYDKCDRDEGYGVYLSSTIKGGRVELLISSSMGGGGTYPSGMFWYNNGVYHAKLTRNERMQITLDESGSGNNYRAICGATTNIQTVAQASTTGPNVFVFAAGNGAGNVPDQFGVMRLYSLKFYNDLAPRELIHDFVPAHRISDDIYGLYDLVAGTWCPNGSTNAFVVGAVAPDGDRLNLTSVRYTGRQLTATLDRAGTDATDIYAAWGTTYGGIEPGNWEHTAKCGAFAEGAETAAVTTPGLGRDAIYVRFYTADGKWSETVYLPDQTMIPAGLFILMR